MASGRIKVDSVSVALDDRGGGQPVVLVHGLVSDRRSAAAVVRGLAERFRVLAPDLPGFGASDKPRSYLYSPDGLGAFVVRLAQTLGLSRYALVGLGSGRAIAARAARRDPDRVVLAAAVAEPFSALALARTLAHWRAVYAARKLYETFRKRQRDDDAKVAAFGSPGELEGALERAFAGAGATAADEAVDEAVERARAEELDRKDRERRRLRVIS